MSNPTASPDNYELAVDLIIHKQDAEGGSAKTEIQVRAMPEAWRATRDGQVPVVLYRDGTVAVMSALFPAFYGGDARPGNYAASASERLHVWLRGYGRDWDDKPSGSSVTRYNTWADQEADVFAATAALIGLAGLRGVTVLVRHICIGDGGVATVRDTFTRQEHLRDRRLAGTADNSASACEERCGSCGNCVGYACDCPGAECVCDTQDESE